MGDPETYRRLKAEDAALVVANVDDMMNTNIAFTIREISQKVPIVANADLDDSVDILQLAGSTYVVQCMKMLGQSLARRVLGTTTRANVIGKIESLLIAEAPAMRTSLVGKTLLQSKLRQTIGINVVGIWERGRFQMPTAQTLINPTTVLLLAGIKTTPSIIITTHDDPTNIFLTIYCRRLSPDVQIISRANIERNISKLHTAGADLVMSYASMAASTIINLLKPDELLMLAEGLNIFRVGVPPSYVGKSVAESQIRTQTGCNVIAICDPGAMCINPGPSDRFSEHNELIMIGSGEAESRFFKMHSEMKKIKAS